MLQSLESGQVRYLVYVIAIQPKFLKHDALFQTCGPRDLVPAEIQLLDIPHLIEAFDAVEIVVRQPALLKVLDTIEAL